MLSYEVYISKENNSMTLRSLVIVRTNKVTTRGLLSLNINLDQLESVILKHVYGKRMTGTDTQLGVGGLSKARMHRYGIFGRVPAPGTSGVRRGEARKIF
jgi:hypothetical protein